MVLRSAWVSLRFFLLLRLIISRLPTQDKRQTLVELFISVNSTKNTTKPRQSKAKPQLNLPSLRFWHHPKTPVILSYLLWLFPHPLHFEEFVCFDVSHPSLCWDCCKVVSFIFFCSFLYLVSVAFSSESLDHEFGGSVSSLRRASHSKARAKHRLTESPSHNN